MSLPLTFSTQLGEVHARSSWDSGATCLHFANHRWNCRVAAPNSLALYKRVPLLVYRGNMFSHTYEPGDFGNCVVFYSGGQRAIVPKPASTDNTPGIPTGILTQSAEGAWTGVGKNNYVPLPGFGMAQILWSNRTVSWSADLSTITVLDDVSCDPNLTPHVVWNMPTQPSTDATQILVLGSDGLTKCLLQMDRACPMKVIGGYPTHYADAFDGTTPTTLDSVFPSGSYTDADRLHAGGFWRVHVALPDGGGKLTTTITVQ